MRPAARRGHRGAPRDIAEVLASYARQLEPASAIGGLQSVWGQIVSAFPLLGGCEPVELRQGCLTVRCEEAVVGEEIRMIAEDVLAVINAAVPDLGIESLSVEAAIQRR